MLFRINRLYQLITCFISVALTDTLWMKGPRPRPVGRAAPSAYLCSSGVKLQVQVCTIRPGMLGTLPALPTLAMAMQKGIEAAAPNRSSQGSRGTLF